ncbi:DUF1850 domain-containing protein [Actinomadura sp. ATCC 31491]|uniref:DUF1850 domain-containing protein n=1 Tax=Actinomadura luzonensis TaxID=2805427 RepID=A0ABT0G2L7_9ACTN|nr:DUF1850 domain-containing protein [Actinomadura luzonensis]MCK2218843.1 DUF1850 domain-containing protein [Actinomadura luzonensis]
MAGLPVTGGFLLAYVHSVHHAPAAEVFTVEGRRFTMRAVVSASGGVLDYYALPGTRGRTRDGGYVLWLDRPATYTELSLLATPIGRRTLVAGRRCLPLAPPAGAVQMWLRVEAAPPARTPGAARGGPCPPPYNQSFFLNTEYSATDVNATSNVENQNPHDWPAPG